MKKILILPFLFAIMPALASTDYSETSEQSKTTKSTQTVVMTAPAKTTQTIKKKHGTVVNNFYFSPTTHINTNNSNNKLGCCNGNRGEYKSGYPVQTGQDNLYSVNGVDKPQYESLQNNTSTGSESGGRKYYLAHPFFQPQAGRFGSVTDFSYAKSSMDINLIDTTIYEILDPTNALSGALNLSGSVEIKQFVVKEDISFGVTDNLALLGMLQYDSTKTQINDIEGWSSNGESGVKHSTSGLNIFGVGLQYRFVDNSDWIAHVAGYFQHQKDSANSFMVDLKAGYKVSRTTIYGLVRGTYSELIDGTAYGVYVEDGQDWVALTYKTDVDNFTMVDFGVGVFSVLSKDWTLNIEGVFGNYDWHNQALLKGAIGWQPGNNFALNLYGQYVLYDSADNKTNTFWEFIQNNSDFSGSSTYAIGNYSINDYSEWKIGANIVLYF